MSYSSVSKCRFYIDTLLWYQSVGLGKPRHESGEKIFDLNPAIRGSSYLDPNNEDVPSYFYDHIGTRIEKLNYMAVLGHDLEFDPAYSPGFRAFFKHTDGSETFLNQPGFGGINITESVNLEMNQFPNPYGWMFYVEKPGYSIARFEDTGPLVNLQQLTVDMKDQSPETKIGAFSLGQTYTTPHSPDLKLTLSFETGTKTIETKSGASLSNTMWRPPMWGNLAAWEIYESYAYQKLARSSRRIWDLSFSFLAKSDTFPKYNSLTTYGTSDSDDNDPDQYTLVGSEHEGADGERVGDFYTIVWNRIGNNLPFIFQPDTEENIFAICKIANNTLKLTQVAFGVYNVKLKIREVW